MSVAARLHTKEEGRQTDDGVKGYLQIKRNSVEEEFAGPGE
jgi:hypothetical protein